MQPLDVIVGTPDMEIPAEPFPFYIATQKGWLVHTPTLFGSARIISKETPSVLPALPEQFLLNGKKLPAFILNQFHDFARKNFEKNRAECSAYITYNHTLDRFRLFIPEQYVSHTSVNHRVGAGEISRGYQAIGTIHSHCDFSAFHSGTDKHDMGKMPGLHITIGFVNRDEPEFVFALSVHDAHFDVTREQIIDDTMECDHRGYKTAPDRWLGFVHTGNAPWTNGVTTNFRPPVTHKPNFPPSTPYKHWTDWDWNDEDYTKRWYGPGKPQQRPQAPRSLPEQQQLNIEAFEKFADIVQESERILEDETAELAFYGFKLSYSIVFDPTRATQWLQAHHIMFEEDDELALLPERISHDDD